MNQQDSLFNIDKFVQRGTKMLELIARNRINTTTKKPNPGVEVGFLRNSLEQRAPQNSSTIDQIFSETQHKILPGMVEWQSPKFFAYYPSNMAETTVYAQMFATAFNTPGFSYVISPSQTELENLVVDWIVHSFGLPKRFLMENEGGGSIMNSASDSVFMTVHVAKKRKIRQLKLELDDPKILKFVGYHAETSHSSLQKALQLKDIYHRRAVPSYFDKISKNYKVDLVKFESILKDDINKGLIPFWFGATLGSTFSGATDQVDEIADICKAYKIWLNVDAAFLGTSWICEDLRDTQKGIEKADSLYFNFSKALFVGIPGTVFYVANKIEYVQLVGGSKIDFSFYKNRYQEQNSVVDYHDWSVGMARRFNSLKFYYLFKYYGLNRLRQTIYKRIQIIKYAEELIQKSEYFQHFSNRSFLLICFRYKYGNKNQNTKRLKALVSDIEQGYVSVVDFRGDWIIRIVVCNMDTKKQHIQGYIQKITKIAEQFTKANNIQTIQNQSS